MALEDYIREKREDKDILLMTHIVLGYPSMKDSLKLIGVMVHAGVDVMELQIPFSEPIADGPTILQANQRALEKGARVQACMDLAQRAAEDFDIPFLIMTYYNILFAYGIGPFAAAMDRGNLQGAIIADLPPEEGREYLRAMEEHHISPVFIFSPKTPYSRMQYIASHSRGFVYCAARKGVTGTQTSFSEDLEDYLEQCRRATSLPLAVGFGVQTRADIQFLKGRAEMAVVGTQTLRVMEENGIEAVVDFIRDLRE